jgi:precorrin-3B methylase
LYSAVVAELSYNPEFRDRVSNIESLLAILEKHSKSSNIIIIYDEVNLFQFN